MIVERLKPLFWAQSRFCPAKPQLECQDSSGRPGIILDPPGQGLAQTSKRLLPSTGRCIIMITGLWSGVQAKHVVGNNECADVIKQADGLPRQSVALTRKLVQVLVKVVWIKHGFDFRYQTISRQINEQTHLISFTNAITLSSFCQRTGSEDSFVTCVRHFTPLHNPNPISLSETIKWSVVRAGGLSCCKEKFWGSNGGRKC